MKAGLLIPDLCVPLLEKHKTSVLAINRASFGSPIGLDLILKVPILSQDHSNVLRQRQNVAADYKKLALHSQLDIAPLLDGHFITVGHSDSK